MFSRIFYSEFHIFFQIIIQLQIGTKINFVVNIGVVEPPEVVEGAEGGSHQGAAITEVISVEVAGPMGAIKTKIAAIFILPWLKTPGQIWSRKMTLMKALLRNMNQISHCQIGMSQCGNFSATQILHEINVSSLRNCNFDNLGHSDSEF